MAALAHFGMLPRHPEERCPLPLAGRARVGVPARASSMRVMLTPPPPTPPRKGEESSARQSYPQDYLQLMPALAHYGMFPVIPRGAVPSPLREG